MPKGWQWDKTLFHGAAPYYERGRLPYAPGLAGALAAALDLDGRGRLLDVGCGPGTIALRVAHLFEQVVGLDPDAGMLAEGARRAAELGIGNATWVRGLAEELPAGLGMFRVATFGRSFHWMNRDVVAAAILNMLEPGGAFVQVSDVEPALPDTPEARSRLPHPPPPAAEVQALVHAYLGPVRRAGQGVLLHGTPDGEAEVLAGAGFEAPEYIEVPGPAYVERTIDDLVAGCMSASGSAPHLFGDRLPMFEAELRGLLAKASPSTLFAEPARITELRIWRMPNR